MEPPEAGSAPSARGFTSVFRPSCSTSADACSSVANRRNDSGKSGAPTVSRLAWTASCSGRFSSISCTPVMRFTSWLVRVAIAAPSAMSLTHP